MHNPFFVFEETDRIDILWFFGKVFLADIYIISLIPHVLLPIVSLSHPSQPAITCSKLNNGNSRTRCVICSKLTIKTPERYFIVNFEHILHFVLVFLL